MISFDLILGQVYASDELEGKLKDMTIGGICNAMIYVVHSITIQSQESHVWN